MAIFDIEINSAAHYPAAAVVELSPLVEEAGFGAIWKGESNSTDPMVLLSGIAARTKKLKLGTAIYHIYGRSAVTLGIQAATLQDMSDGRLLLGLGVANTTIAGWHGGVFDHPLTRIREYLEVVRKTATGEKIEYAGKFVNTGQRFQLSWKPKHPTFPIVIAGLGPQMTALAGKVADGVMINMATPAKVREIAARVREGAIAAGRDPKDVKIITKVRVSLNPDRAQARARLRQVLTFYNIADYYKDMLKGCGFEADVERINTAFKEGGFKAAQAALTDEYMDRMPVVPGTSIQEIRDKLQPFVETGVDRLITPYVPSTDAVVEEARRYIEAWGKYEAGSAKHA